MERERSYHLDIAGIRVLVRGGEGELFAEPGPLTEFLSPPGAWAHGYEVRVRDRLAVPAGEAVFRSPSAWCYREDDAWIRLSGPLEQGPERARVRSVRRGRETVLEFLRTEHLETVTPRLLLNAMDLPRLLVEHEGFLLHASFIAYAGGAIVFTAPSETGKSTQARLWCDHAGAELVNGDRAGVRIVDGQVLACGTPFSGSSPVRRNVTLPLRAIVCLSQAPENTIQRLRGVRAFRRVWEGCTVSTWDREAVELASLTLSRVLDRVPVYHLACTPDLRAVELLKHTLEVAQ